MLISADAVICGCGGISIPPHLVENLYFGLYADVVELVDTLDSGSSAGNSMKVQVLSSA